MTGGNATVNEGTVTFTVKDGGGTVIGSPVTSGSVTGGTASATFALGATAAGRYSIFTTYNPAVSSPSFNTSSGAAGALTLTTTVMRVSSGAYTGDGVAGSQINQLGFVPDVVIVKGDSTQEPVLWTSTMSGGLAKPMSSGSASAANLIQASIVNGFKVGTDARVNTSGASYYWTAFGAATGGLVVGTYTGNGTSQSIAGMGFQPDLVIVSGANTTVPVFRSSALAGSVGLSGGTALTTRITSFDASGFSVGADAAVNAAGVAYHYAAWTTATGKVAVGSYAGSAAARSVTGLGFGPQVAIVKSYDCTAAGVEHSSALGPSTDASLPFDNSAGQQASRITALQSNGFGVGTSSTVNGSGCNYGWMAFAGDAPTSVKLKSTGATQYDNGTFVEWKTGYESANLGFNVYREENGVRTRITGGLVAGSGLLVGPGAAATTANSYGWWDLSRTKGAAATYWLEDVDLDGTRTYHGPIVPTQGASQQAEGDRARSALLSGLGRQSRRAVEQPVPAAGNTGVPARAILSWAPVRGATSYDIRFGTGSQPDVTVASVATARYVPPAMAEDTTYFWQVVAHFADEVVAGPVWSFTTEGSLPGISGEATSATTDPLRANLNSLATTTNPARPTRGAAGGGVPVSGTVGLIVAPRPTAAAAGLPVADAPPQTRSVDPASAAAAVTLPPASTPTAVAAAAPPAPALSRATASTATAPAVAVSARAAMEDAPGAGSFGSMLRAVARPRNVRTAWQDVPPVTGPAAASLPGLSPLARQEDLASGAAIKLSIRQTGWYRVTRTALAAAGLAADADPATLQLYGDGIEQPTEILVDGTGSFVLEFYATGSDSTSSDERVYWLTPGSRPGLRVASAAAPARGGAEAASFPFTVEKKDRTIYFAALLNGDADNFFGDVVGSDAVDEVIATRHVDAAGADATLEVTLQGVTEADGGDNHLVDVQLNGVPVGQMAFGGRQHHTRAFTVASSSLREGDNTVTLAARGGDSDISLVDVIHLTYPHLYAADADELRLSAAGGESVSVYGFSTPAIRVIDVTSPLAAVDVAGTVTGSGDGFRVSFQAPGAGRRTLVAFTDGHVLAPAAIRANAPTRWHDAGNAADYVILSPKDFLGATAPLKALRESQGHTVAVVDVEDIYDEFSYGQKRPEAIRDFLVRAHGAWATVPKFVVLLGNATTDPRNYLGTNEPDYLPTRLVTTAVLETASDDWFADADGDGLAELAMIGRLPARSLDQAVAMVNKIVAYERADAGPWANAIAVVADASGPDDGDFAGMSERLGQLVPAPYTVEQIFRGRSGTDASRASLLAAINEGRAVINYAGHGSVESWQDNLMTTADAQSFTNGVRLPLFVMMDCLNGFFHGIFPEESLAESLIRAPNGGAVAVWASSGFTAPGSQVPLDHAFFRELFAGGGRALGEAVAAAKRQATDTDVRRTWILFGDPATRLKGLR